MSDLRLEDLLTYPHDGVEACSYCDALRLLTRPVTRTEVLEALGAERKWVCWALNGRRCTGPWPEGPVPRTHGGCGWRWVVTDE